MLLKRFFLEQLEREAVASRKAIERTPEGENTWKPHERSMELGYLMIELDELDLDSPSGASFRTRPAASRADLLQQLDEGLARSRKALENTSEVHLNTTWRLKMGDQVLTEGPRYAMIADGALSHLAHHRGQLTVYLRLKESKVPAIYGPSADEWH